MSYTPKGYIPFKEALDEITNSPNISNPTNEMRDWLFAGQLNSYWLPQDGDIEIIPKYLWADDKADQAFKSGEFTECYLGKRNELSFKSESYFTPPYPMYDRGDFKVSVLIRREDLERRMKGFAIDGDECGCFIQKFLPDSPKLQALEATLSHLDREGLDSRSMKTKILYKEMEKIFKGPNFKDFKFSENDKYAIYNFMRNLDESRSPSSKKKKS